MQHIGEATLGERWEVVEIPILNKDGTVYILLWNSASIYDTEGEEDYCHHRPRGRTLPTAESRAVKR